MKPTTNFRALALLAWAIAVPGEQAARAAETETGASAVNPDSILRQMSDQLGAAKQFSFKTRREIDSDLAGGDGLHGRTTLSVLVQRPDKVMAQSKVPGDVRRLYFDGKQLSLADEQKKLYSTVSLTATLDKLPSELAKIYGFMPPMADFLVSDLYQDLKWRAKSVEYRGIRTINTGFLGLKHVSCHCIGLTGQHADSELWIGVKDLLPRRWNSKVKQPQGDVEIRLEFSDWDLKAKTRDTDFVFTAGKDALPIPMATVAEMATAHNPAK
jgi:hypothetical protein